MVTEGPEKGLLNRKISGVSTWHIRKNNMNPKNIGSYKEGEGEEERHGLEAKAGSRRKKHKANVAEERI